MGQVPKKWLLAIQPTLGAIFHCERCDKVHIRLESFEFHCDAPTYMAFVDMVNRSAANFEMMLQTRAEAVAPEQEGLAW